MMLQKQVHPYINRSRIFFMAFSFIAMITSIKSQSPGGYATGLRFWIKANASTFSDAGVTPCTNSTAVQQWNDLSGNGFNASQPTSNLRPTYFSTGANGNPVVRYGGTHFVDVPGLGISGTADYYAFCVVKLTSPVAGGVSDGNGSYVIDRTTATNELFDIKVISVSGTNRFFFQKRNDAGGNLGGPTSSSVVDPAGFQLVSIGREYNSGSSTLSRIYVNGELENTQSNGVETTTPPNMRIGRHATNATGGMIGDLAEVIVYNNFPSPADKQKIESYLAVKYGFSLYQNTLTDYLSSNATVIYPATTTHSAYINTITGIGMDNGSGLLQTNSINQSTNDFVQMQNPSAMSNGDFLLWGNNNATMITPNTADVDGAVIQRRLSRVWRVSHIGNIGTVDVSIDLSTVPGSKSQADLRLLIDRDGDGFADNDVSPLTGTLTGNIFSVSGVSFQHGDYFTIGTTNAVSSPLPIELTEFRSICHDNTIELTWSTASEKGNAYFVIERSTDGVNWTDIEHLKGSGNSSSTKRYTITDNFNRNELRYYRLTQVDLNGNTETFKLLSSFCFDNNEKITVYPNPAGKELFIDLNLSQDYGDMELKIVNAAGKICTRENIRPIKGSNTFKISLNLEPGPYTLLLNSPGWQLPTQKIIVK